MVLMLFVCLCALHDISKVPTSSWISIKLSNMIDAVNQQKL